MQTSLLSAIAEFLVTSVIEAWLELWGLEKAAELAACVFGLACLAIGAAVWWSGS